jgi:RNA-directed DNA polymerase
MKSAKDFDIPKMLIWDAYRDVKCNSGSPVVDGQSMEGFEGDLKNNLYKIWSWMSSWSYFPPSVLQVEIPKSNGGVRQLGIDADCLL